MQKFYSPSKARLIFVEEEATPEHWDAQWGISESIRDQLPKSSSDSFVVKTTKRYMRPEDGPILEGGCGKGHYVYSLGRSGYSCTGVDFAEKTVRVLNEHVPELDIVFGDVRALQFADSSFSGYWSLGVIEHFWEGYEPIVKEMARVIRPGGYLFLTFPFMSFLRRAKAALRLYPRWEGEEKMKGFYQFALDHRHVIRDLERLGFEVEEVTSKDGLKGFKDEVTWLRPLLQPIYGYNGKNIIVRVFRKALDVTFSPFAGHSVLIVLRRANRGSA